MCRSSECKSVSGTKEWAFKNENCISGCIHNCKYCYARSIARRFSRMKSADWHHEVVRHRDLNKSIGKCNGVVMFPSSHDITPEHLNECMFMLDKILAAGNDDVLVISKPHLECMTPVCDEFTAYRDKIVFRFTIGSTDSAVLKFWEPNAPNFDERLQCLKYAYESGFKTSISCEPMLDDKVENVIRAALPYVTDSIWVGKPNRLMSILSLNGYKGDQETMTRARQLQTMLSDEYVNRLYSRYKNNPYIRWKDSIKKVVGIERPTKAGLDI